MRLNPLSVRYCAPPAFAGAMPQRKETAAHANGRRYESKVTDFVRCWCVGNRYDFKDHPWIQYQEPSGQLKWAQPDYVLLSQLDDNALIVEAKLRHTRDVVPQLGRYRELIAALHPEFKASLVEICRYFDPDEYRMELLSELRPHSFPYASVLFEPRAWTQALN